MTSIRVLLVEDDDTLRKVLTRELGDAGFEVHAYATAEPALECASREQPHVALIDLRIPGMSGLDLLAQLPRACPHLQAVMLTGHGGVPEAVEAMRRGAYDFLTKPTRLEVLEQVLRRAAEKGALLLENQRLRLAASSHDDPSGMQGSGPAMEELRDLVSRIGPTDAAVLIEGENGVGKELLARNLHRLSPRRDHPWVVVNCGAISSELVESELFGHERGAFTGAERKRPGLFEAADGGTLFLDEIGELPLPIQPVLLRAVQFGEIRPVGSTRTKTVDVRVLSATNRDLAADVSEKRFREDLYYRLATFQVTVPPLRERREDIPELARSFLLAAAERTGRDLVLDDSAVEALARHAWPGNVRELETVITRLSVLSPDDVIRAADVAQLGMTASRAATGELPTLNVDELERMATLAALERSGGDRQAAADLLGVSVRTLYNKLKAMDVS